MEKLRPAYEAWQRELGSDVAERDLAALTRTVDRLIERLQSAE